MDLVGNTHSIPGQLQVMLGLMMFGSMHTQSNNNARQRRLLSRKPRVVKSQSGHSTISEQHGVTMWIPIELCQGA